MKGFTVENLDEIFPLADFIADSLGDVAEVLVHNVSDLESSIVHIRNGELSGRHVGDGTTDQALKLIKTGRAHDHEYVCGYKGSAGSHQFRSSTYFIKNSQQELIGLLCVNINITGIADAIDALSKFYSNDADKGQLPATDLEENLQGDWSETIRRIVHRAVAQSGIRTDRMTRDERLEVIRSIQGEGVFLMKGAVGVVAPELGCSVPTLYRYLQEIKEE